MMNKENLNKFMNEVDKTKRPKHWKKFINKNTEHCNVILKYGKSAFCTHCQKYFYKEVKIHPYKQEICPYCNKKYYVRNNNLKNFSMLTDIAFYTKRNNQIVLRIFEIESKYDYQKRKFKNSIQEYARFIPNIRNSTK